MSNEKLDFNDVSEIVEKFKPQAKEIWNELPHETVSKAKKLAAAVALDIINRGSRQILALFFK